MDEAIDAAERKVVNFEKSEINFSKGVPITTAQELADRLEVRKVEKHGIYPGRIEAPQDELSVKDLMLPNGTEWDEGRIMSIFNEEDAQQILKIPLRYTGGQDVLTWVLNPNGRYSVKSGYKLARQIANADSASSSRNVPWVWQWIWNLKVPPKIQIFIWKAMHGIIPTKANLLRRACDIYPLCGRCHNTEETMEHALRDCPWSQFYWKASPLRISDHILKKSHATISDMIMEISKVKNEEYAALFAVLLWALWYSRNLLQFQGKTINHQDCYNIRMKCLHDYQQVQGSSNTPSKLNSPKKWKRPQKDFLKINTDASVRSGIGTGLGVVIRDHEGKIVRTLVRKLPHIFEIDVKDLSKTWKSQSPKRGIQTDAFVGKRTPCNRHEDLSYPGSLMEDIKVIDRDFASIAFNHIPRTANELAHKLASFAFDVSCNGFFSGIIPPDFPHGVTSEICNPI
ncbi:hypothetical protein DH2020_003831 [Rehmannia glutinosa]|uniref:Reverse transcriptase zinc-binding domain-containing protein n=1 Tax=Rehmannia glutinosa TaxID=99300 RepID=A0ABR0XMR2_REHGL